MRARLTRTVPSGTRALCALVLGVAPVPTVTAQEVAAAPPRPNVVLCMTDDQGWGDAGYQGHARLRTPHLDAMAAAGLRFRRFYAAAPVCSPTRGSCLTGRHPSRYGITGANVGHLPAAEVTLAEALRAQGYATGHFGKWHLGTLSRDARDSNRGGRPETVRHHAPPWEHGFEVCFSTEAKVPTFDPMLHPATGEPYGTAYWNERGERETEGLEGDDARVILDRALPFVRAAAQAGRPFFAVIWFHAPHRPVRAGPRHLAPYRDVEDEATRHYYGCLTAMDEQVGRLRRELRALGVADDTMLWFCSDNGPEGRAEAPGSAGPLRGRKRSLHEGGVRVPGLLEWPARIREGREVDEPCCTSDYLPTVLDVLGLPPPAERELDGVSLLPLIEGRAWQRPRPIGFAARRQLALVAKRYKVLSRDGGATFALYDLLADPGETTDLAAREPAVLADMVGALRAWRRSCEAEAGARGGR